MSREAWRRWMRTMMENRGRRAADGRSWSHEIVKERTTLSQVCCDGQGGGFRGLQWIAGRGVTVAHWRNIIAFHGQELGVMPSKSVRHYAAPLSRTGKSLQNPTRVPKADPNAPPEPDKPERRINRAIVSRTVRLITNEGHKILTRMEALKHAEHMDLDLVEVDGKQDPPVCKLMDFNKERFKDRQRERELKKKQSERRRLDDLKEVRFSTRTAQNDLELKAQMASRLLTKGHRVKLAVIPHGNDDLEPKGRELINRMVALLQDSSKVETGPRIERQRAWVLIRPISVGGTKGTSKKRKEGTALVETVNDTNASDSEDNHAC